MVSISVCQVCHPGSRPWYCLYQKGRMLSECYQLFLTSADNWFTKGLSMCYHVYVTMHVKDPQLPAVRVGHRVPLAGFCLSLYNLHVLNSNNMIKKRYIQTDEPIYIKRLCCTTLPIIYIMKLFNSSTIATLCHETNSSTELNIQNLTHVYIVFCTAI